MDWQDKDTHLHEGADRAFRMASATKDPWLKERLYGVSKLYLDIARQHEEVARIRKQFGLDSSNNAGES
jgi:hypothetical protein